MPGFPPPDAVESAYGRIDVDRCTFAPLDIVKVRIRGRAQGDTHATIRVCDRNQRPYFEAEVSLADNMGETQFVVAGQLGVQYIYLIWPGEAAHSRYTNIWVDCETSIATGDVDFDDLYSFTRDMLRRGRREYQTPRGRFVGYISGDTWHFDGIWLRDGAYALAGYRYWERDLQCGMDRFLEAQRDDGMMADGIERDGHTWRVGLESDVEYIAVLAVWLTWQATGDDAWMAATLERLERGLAYVQRDALHWDETHQLVKRQHSCDTWDFDIDGASDKGDSRHVIATCDQSGYVAAFCAMSAMYRSLGREADARRWSAAAEEYRQRAADLLWDGTKFQHHVHLDAIDHGSFDETEQLAMGNVWAMTRGLATPQQARSIIDEYRRRQEATGDAYPWWSLQPGYPDDLGYYAAPFLRQGGYANGGLMPWVGGELCRAAFLYGREAYGVRLLRQYADHLRRTGGAHVWYWPDGEPGFRTTNEVQFTGWGMAEWLQALIGGLAGVEDAGRKLDTVRVSPRWAAAGIADATITTRYLASDGYFAYQQAITPEKRQIHLICSGSGERISFHVLLPEGWQVGAVTVDSAEIEFQSVSEGASQYVDFATPLAGLGHAVIQCQ